LHLGIQNVREMLNAKTSIGRRVRKEPTGNDATLTHQRARLVFKAYGISS
jgi:hypothetical protein